MHYLPHIAALPYYIHLAAATLLCLATIVRAGLD